MDACVEEEKGEVLSSLLGVAQIRGYEGFLCECEKGVWMHVWKRRRARCSHPFSGWRRSGGTSYFLVDVRRVCGCMCGRREGRGAVIPSRGGADPAVRAFFCVDVRRVFGCMWKRKRARC